MPSRDVWAQRVSAWKQSGLSASAFAAVHGFQAHSLYFWSSRLRLRDNAPAEVRFAQLVPASSPPSSVPLEILLATGHVVRVSSGFDPALLRAVLGVLEAS